MLHVSGGKGNEIVSLKKVKDTHPKEFSDYANMISKIKTILEMDAFSEKLV